MPASKLNTLASLADDSARRTAAELESMRSDFEQTRAKYDRLVAYASDYRDSPLNNVTPAQLESRSRFELRIDQHIVALGEDLARRRLALESLEREFRDQRASASALLALQARGEDDEMRRQRRRSISQVDAMIAARHVSATREGRSRSSW